MNIKQFLVNSAKPVFIITFTILLIVGIFQTKLAPVFHTTQSISTDFSVTGEGIVAVAPDQAEISLGIIVNDTSVKSAQTKANSQIETVKTSLKSLGIKNEDIKTISYNINPNYDYTSTNRAIKDYTVNITLNIKVTELNKVGEVIDAGTAGGLNTINNLQFSLKDRQKALDQARELAVDNAKRQAEITSKTAGISLGKIIYYSEYEQGSDSYLHSYDANSLKSGIGGSEPAVAQTDINPGSGEIKLSVTLTYKTL